MRILLEVLRNNVCSITSTVDESIKIGYRYIKTHSSVPCDQVQLLWTREKLVLQN